MVTADEAIHATPPATHAKPVKKVLHFQPSISNNSTLFNSIIQFTPYSKILTNPATATEPVHT